MVVSRTAEDKVTSNGSRPAKRRTKAKRGAIEIALGDVVNRPLKASERVAREVVRRIITDGLSTGDGLASEAQMLDEFQVSRESLREGLRLLEVQGLITIRRGPGGGPIVGTVDPATLGRVSTLYYHMAGATYAELYEAWVVSEGVLANRAARNPDAELRRQIMEPFLGEEAHSGPDDDLANYIHSKTAFHAAVAKLANNRVLELSYQAFGQIVSHHIAVVDDPRSLKDDIIHDHQRLARAIIDGQATKAMNIMIEHIETVAAFSSAHMGTKVADLIEWH